MSWNVPSPDGTWTRLDRGLTVARPALSQRPIPYEGVYGSRAVTPGILRDRQSGARIWPHEMGHVAQAIRDDLLLNFGVAHEISSRLGVEDWLIIDSFTPLRSLSNRLERIGPEAQQWQNSWYEREVEASRGRNLCLDPVTPCYW